MKTLLVALLLVATQAHASAVARGDHGHHGYGAGVSGSLKGAPSSAPAAQSGNGGRDSLVDDFQPFPESEVRQFQKPHWTPYTGE